MVASEETIVAIATPPGRGGVGVVRVSGPLVAGIAVHLLKKCPKEREVYYSSFIGEEGHPIDKGLALYFKGPKSFTGEDVLELHGHGGPIILDLLVNRIVSLGARLARPGEFSERAFLNNKMDLLQVESVLELINATSKQAAKAAMRSLQGDFSRLIHKLLDSIIFLRMYIEASLDFPDEEVDVLSEGNIKEKLDSLLKQIKNVCVKAEEGVKCSSGVKVVIVGKPNAGKSSLLNALSGMDAAIVTDIPGTTRDVLREDIHLDGCMLQLVDTAGLRESDNVIENEGIKRALKELDTADHVLVVLDSEQENQNTDELFLEWQTKIPDSAKITFLYNKMDVLKSSFEPKVDTFKNYTRINLSVKTGVGLDEFIHYLKHSLRSETTEEGNFFARRRHVEALLQAQKHIELGFRQFSSSNLELLAEELRLSQEALGNITGKFTSDDLLGRIFNEFCIGK